MRKQDNNILIIVLVVLLLVLLLGGFGMMGFSGYGMKGMMYGNNYLCSTSGGIWCYFPIFGFIFNLVFWIAIFVLIYLILKNLSSKGGRK